MCLEGKKNKVYLSNCKTMSVVLGFDNVVLEN